MIAFAYASNLKKMLITSGDCLELFADCCCGSHLSRDPVPGGAPIKSARHY